MDTKKKLWYTFLVSMGILTILWGFFTYTAVDTISAAGGGTGSKLYAPIDIMLWMFSPDNPIFILVIIVAIVGVAAGAIMRFHPAFKTVQTGTVLARYNNIPVAKVVNNNGASVPYKGKFAVKGGRRVSRARTY